MKKTVISILAILAAALSYAQQEEWVYSALEKQWQKGIKLIRAGKHGVRDRIQNTERLLGSLCPLLPEFVLLGFISLVEDGYFMNEWKNK